MKRKLPVCATCGKSLLRKVRVVCEFGDILGKPMIGWHGIEVCLDAVAKSIINASGYALEKVIYHYLDELEKRGVDRVRWE